MRLIDADALISDYPTICSRSMKFNLDLAPTIDAASVGRWEWYEEWVVGTTDNPQECQSAGYRCSACEIDLSEYLSSATEETIYLDNPNTIPKLHFCPNCGATMSDMECMISGTGIDEDAAEEYQTIIDTDDPE